MSNGTGYSFGASPAARRRVECRPSVATTRSARSSPSVPSAVAVADPGHPAAVPDQRGGGGTHPQREGRFCGGGVGKEVQEVPLRHQRDVVVRRRQRLEVAHRHRPPARDREGDVGEPALRQPAELLAEAQFIDQPDGRGVDGVAAEITEEIGVLLQYRHIHACPGQQQPQHHPGRAAADHHASGRLHGHTLRPRGPRREGFSRRIPPCAAVSDRRCGIRAAPVRMRSAGPKSPADTVEHG